MKQFFLLLLLLSSINISAQQSKSTPYRPSDIDLGKISNGSKSQIVINGVPSYLWHRGCGPTALGMVVGYYDLHGFPDLIPGDASTQTTEVYYAIANNEHYDDYSLPLDYYPNILEDKSELGGAHESNCIADYMQTSWSSENNYWGWSWSSDISPAFESYINQQNPNYLVTTDYEWFGTSSWDIYKEEIDNNRPVVILVDTDGDGSTDHFVTGIGYDEETDEYGIYDTWDHNIHWFEFREMSSSYSWGIYGFNILNISGSSGVNEPYKTVKIYPNPADDIITVHSVVPYSTIFISDLTGKYMLSTNKSDIDVSNLIRGIYILEIRTLSETFKCKILKK